MKCGHKPPPRYHELPRVDNAPLPRVAKSHHLLYLQLFLTSSPSSKPEGQLSCHPRHHLLYFQLFITRSLYSKLEGQLYCHPRHHLLYFQLFLPRPPSSKPESQLSCHPRHHILYFQLLLPRSPSSKPEGELSFHPRYQLLPSVDTAPLPRVAQYHHFFCLLALLTISAFQKGCVKCGTSGLLLYLSPVYYPETQRLA